MIPKSMNAAAIYGLNLLSALNSEITNVVIGYD